MDRRKIKRNIIQCRLCGDVIESKSVHDFVCCKCKSCFVDGGKEYARYGAKNLDNVILLTEYEEDDT